MDSDQQNRPCEPFSWLRRLSDLLKPIGDWRDGLLIAVGIVYVAGYVVWSFNAWQNKMGLLPALDPQYFAAGLVPVVILSAAAIGGRYLKRFVIDIWPSLVGMDARGTWRVFRNALLLVFWGLLTLVGLGPVLGPIVLLGYIATILLKRLAPAIWSRLAGRGAKGWELAMRQALYLLFFVALIFFTAHRQDLTVAVFAGSAETVDQIALYSFAISVTLLPPMEDRVFSWLSQAYRTFWVYFGVLVFVFLGLVLYMENIYPNLPQEFGGVRPRCAYVDVAQAQLSTETLEGIVPVVAINSSQPVVRSVKIEILYSGTASMLVRSQGKIYELARDVVQAVTVCD